MKNTKKRNKKNKINSLKKKGSGLFGSEPVQQGKSCKSIFGNKKCQPGTVCTPIGKDKLCLPPQTSPQSQTEQMYSNMTPPPPPPQSQSQSEQMTQLPTYPSTPSKRFTQQEFDSPPQTPQQTSSFPLQMQPQTSMQPQTQPQMPMQSQMQPQTGIQQQMQPQTQPHTRKKSNWCGWSGSDCQKLERKFKNPPFADKGFGPFTKEQFFYYSNIENPGMPENLLENSWKQSEKGESLKIHKDDIKKISDYKIDTNHDSEPLVTYNEYYGFNSQAGKSQTQIDEEWNNLKQENLTNKQYEDLLMQKRQIPKSQSDKQWSKLKLSVEQPEDSYTKIIPEIETSTQLPIQPQSPPIQTQTQIPLPPTNSPIKTPTIKEYQQQLNDENISKALEYQDRHPEIMDNLKKCFVSITQNIPITEKAKYVYSKINSNKELFDIFFISKITKNAELLNLELTNIDYPNESLNSLMKKYNLDDNIHIKDINLLGVLINGGNQAQIIKISNNKLKIFSDAHSEKGNIESCNYTDFNTNIESSFKYQESNNIKIILLTNEDKILSFLEKNIGSDIINKLKIFSKGKSAGKKKNKKTVKNKK